MQADITSLVYDVDVRHESKWNLLDPTQKARFIEMVLLSASLEQLVKYHDDSVKNNAAHEPTKSASAEEKEFYAACFEEWNKRIKERRPACWTEKGVSLFRTEVRDARQRTIGSAIMASEFAKAMTDIERKAGMTHSAAGLKASAGATMKLLVGINNSHTVEGRALKREATKELVLIRNTELREAELEQRVRLKTRELDQRQQTKIEAALKQIASEAGKNPKIKAAVEVIRAETKGDA